MSELLKDVMEERAAEVDAHGIDPVALVRAGRGRVHRRRAGSFVAATACAAVLAAGLSGVLLRDGGVDGSAPAGPTERVTMTYSTGSTLVVGDAKYDAGAEVMSFVRTRSATVFTTPDGTIHLLAGSGPARDIGVTSTDGYYLTADPDTDRVAWVEWPVGKSPEFVVYDVAAGREVWRDSTGTTPDMKAFRDDRDVAHVYALDGGTLYRRDSRGAVAVDLATEEATVLSEKGGMRTVADADGGRVAWDGGAQAGLTVGRSYGTGVATHRTSTPLLSPGGSYLSTEDGDEFLIQRTSDATDVSPELPGGYTFAAAYGWADDDTVLVFGFTGPLGGTDPTHDTDFLACSVADGTCTKVASDRIDYEHFSLPVGEKLGD